MKEKITEWDLFLRNEAILDYLIAKEKGDIKDV